MAPEQQALFDDMPQPKKDKRTRYQFRFWLDGNKDDELLLASDLDERKQERRFASFIRNAIQILVTLEEGRVDILERAFPWIADHYKEKYSSPDTPVNEEFAAMIAAKVAQHAPTMQVPVPQPVAVGHDVVIGDQARADLETLAADVNIFSSDNTQTVSGEDARESFSSGMGDLFGGDDDDDIWD